MINSQGHVSNEYSRLADYDVIFKRLEFYGLILNTQLFSSTEKKLFCTFTLCDSQWFKQGNKKKKTFLQKIKLIFYEDDLNTFC